MAMDAIFDALAHPIRRSLLDHLSEKDGQTLSELEHRFDVTRFAVMKHLRILEDVHLVVTRKVGREKYHYLNPLPIQEVSDRWISRYASPFARAMSDLRTQAEARIPAMTEKAPVHVYELYVKADPEAVWAILTDDEKTPLWQHFNMNSRTDWRVGGSIEFLLGEQAMIVGELLELTPPRRLVHSFSARWSPDVAADTPSRVTWDIVPIANGACKLVLTHDDFAGATATSKAVTGGWPEALSRLKTLLETGEAFVIPAPAE